MSTTATPSVLIQSLIRRAGGTKIELYGEKYHFKPESAADDALHVCAIPFDHAAQIHRLLAITSGYALVDPNADLPGKPKAAPVQTIHADKAAAEEDKAPAPVEPVTIQGPDGKDIVLTAMDRPELVQFAKEHFKIAVHHKWSPATIIAKILEAMRAPSDEE